MLCRNRLHVSKTYLQMKDDWASRRGLSELGGCKVLCPTCSISGGPYICSELCFLNNLSELQILTTLYLAKNDHQWVTLISLKTIKLPGLPRSSMYDSLKYALLRIHLSKYLLANFRELVLGCIEAKRRNHIPVGKLLTRSVNFTFLCTSPTSKIQQIFVANFGDIFMNFKQNHWNFAIFAPIFAENASNFIGISQISSKYRKKPKIIGFFNFRC